MLPALRQKTIVGKGGKIEISSSELPDGAVVEVIILVEPVEQDMQDFVRLSYEDRQRVLAQQAEQMAAHYMESASDREAWQAGDFLED